MLRGSTVTDCGRAVTPEVQGASDRIILPVAQGAPTLPDLHRCHVALRQEVTAQAVGDPLRRAIGAAPLSVLSTCVTKQTGDMVYSEARWLWMLCLWAGTTMLYALERESNLGSTSAVFVELSEGRDVGSGPVP